MKLTRKQKSVINKAKFAAREKTARAKKVAKRLSTDGWTFESEKVGPGQYLGWALNYDELVSRECGPMATAAAAVADAKATARRMYGYQG